MSNTSNKISTFRSNIFALKLLYSMSPKLVVHDIISRFLGYFEWLFYSAFFMRFVINSLETGQAFSHIMIFLGITVFVF